MYQYIVQSSVTNRITHNLLHINTTCAIQTIGNTIMSSKLTSDTMYLYVVKSPITTMSIYIALKISVRLRTVFHVDGHPMMTGSVRGIDIADKQ